MEMTDFLNSGDIAEHWRRIGFFCTPLQSAYLVWHNRTKTLAEKHAAWREIIQSMPDCPVAQGHRKTNMGLSDTLAGSLHDFLQAFVSLQEKLIGQFYRKGDHAAYRYRVLYEGDEDWSRDSWLYDSADDCFDDISVDEKLAPSILYVQLTKQWIGSNRAITLFARADQTILQLDADGLSEAEADLLRAFEWMWFDFLSRRLSREVISSSRPSRRSDICSMAMSRSSLPVCAAGEAKSCVGTGIPMRTRGMRGQTANCSVIVNAPMKRI